jgi:hypothetical protein
VVLPPQAISRPRKGEAAMAIDYQSLLNYRIPEVRQSLRWQDTALYNFSIGLGQDPMDERQLDFLYEPRLKAMPSMPVVLASPGFWPIKYM